MTAPRFGRLLNEMHQVRRPKLPQRRKSFIAAFNRRFDIMFDHPGQQSDSRVTLNSIIRKLMLRL